MNMLKLKNKYLVGIVNFLFEQYMLQMKNQNDKSERYEAIDEILCENIITPSTYKQIRLELMLFLIGAKKGNIKKYDEIFKGGDNE